MVRLKLTLCDSASGTPLAMRPEHDGGPGNADRRIDAEPLDERLRALADIDPQGSRTCDPFRHVSMTNEIAKAIRSGNQPPSRSLVEVEAKNRRSSASRPR